MNDPHLGQFIQQIKILSCTTQRNPAHRCIANSAHSKAAAQGVECVGATQSRQVQHVMMKLEFVKQRRGRSWVILEKMVVKDTRES